MIFTAEQIEEKFIETMKRLDAADIYGESLRFALSSGFVRRSFGENSTLDSVKLYPFTFFPTAFPRNEFDRSIRIQRKLNFLIDNLASNFELLESVLQPISHCDDFLANLWKIFVETRSAPFSSVAESCIVRTDFMLKNKEENRRTTQLRLIEINTIAVGLGGAAKTVQQWHKRVLKRHAPEFLSMLPENESHELIVETLFRSWKIYGNTQALVVFVVPEREFNLCDQSLIEEALCQRIGSWSVVKFATFNELAENCSIDADGNLFLSKKEVALVYYRHGYDPKDFTNEKIWRIYRTIEFSRAVKCPSLRYHLVGMKCFQSLFVDRKFLEKICPADENFLDEIEQINEEIFSLERVKVDPIVQRRIEENPESFYLKQSREGGGNVFCGSDLKNRIDQIFEQGSSKRFFLMSRVFPQTTRNFIRSPDKEIFSFERINSELGIFSGLIRQNGRTVFETVAGSLLRSKPAQNIEGGIASGQGCIDSLLLH